MQLIQNKLLSSTLAGSLALLFVASLAGCSKTTPPPPPEESTSIAYKEGEAGLISVDTIKMSMKVVSINAAERALTLLGSDGEESTINVGPEALNFDQIKTGDMVNITLIEETVIAVFLADEAIPEEGSAGMVMLAAKGAKAGGVAVGTTIVTANVIAIDQPNHTAVLQFKDGSTRTVPVREDVDLSKYKIGEQVVFRFTVAVVISLQKQEASGN